MSGGLTPRQRRAALARFYDVDVIDQTEDIEIFQQLAHDAGGPVLELAVGSGRLAIPLALAGHNVVGVDDDAAMLRRARAAWKRVRGRLDPGRFSLRAGDLACYRVGADFGLVFIAVNTFLLAPDDRARLDILTAMREQLREGGTAAVEFSTPDEAELARYDGRLQLEWLRTDPETGDEVSKSMSARYDPDVATLELTQLFEWTPRGGGALSRVARTDTLHLVSAARLAALADEAGFGAVDLRGDHLLMPYGAGSHRVILVARSL